MIEQMTSNEGKLDSPMHTQQLLNNIDDDDFSPDEFINSILAEEIQALDHDHDGHPSSAAVAVLEPSSGTFLENNAWDIGTLEQPMVQREGSLTLSSPLSPMSVDEVWDEIQSNELENLHNACTNIRNPPRVLNRRRHLQASPPMQKTYVGMTLEDFLTIVGVLENPRRPRPPRHHTYSALCNLDSTGILMTMPPRIASRPEMLFGGSVGEEPPDYISMIDNNIGHSQQQNIAAMEQMELAPISLTLALSSDPATEGDGENGDEMEM